MKNKPIRLTTTSYAVLTLVYLYGEATPYELKQALVRSIENFWPVPHTTFYEEPARLAGAGYLAERQEQSGRRRKHYSLTKDGERALREWADAPGAAPPQLRDEALLKVFAGADPQHAYTGRLEWHRAKLAELEGYLQELRADDAPREERLRGVETTLLGGVEYERQMIGIIERLSAALTGSG
jgi:PadR family transcriptional regulator, regulatory protein AphA